MTGTARSARYDLVDDTEIAALREVAEDRMRDLEARAAEIERIRALLDPSQPC